MSKQGNIQPQRIGCLSKIFQSSIHPRFVKQDFNIGSTRFRLLRNTAPLNHISNAKERLVYQLLFFWILDVSVQRTHNDSPSGLRYGILQKRMETIRRFEKAYRIRWNKELGPHNLQAPCHYAVFIIRVNLMPSTFLPTMVLVFFLGL